MLYFLQVPITAKGERIVSINAIRHGIFTKDLITTSSMKELESEYQEMLANLIDCLSPQDQMESLLVEKIALDFWRLKRVLRFESGSIEKHLEMLSKEFYSCGRENNEKLNERIKEKEEYSNWIAAYLEHLKKEEVSFDQPIWIGEDIESDIVDDFYLIAKTLTNLTDEEQKRLNTGSFDFIEIKELLRRKGCLSAKEISPKLIEIYTRQDQRLIQEIENFKKNKCKNEEADRMNSLLAIIPQQENTDKILKYERSIQKSIFQNLLLLKRLQELH